MLNTSPLARAGRWFLDSGIQESNGGVARYYESDLRKNKPVSTEITGYTASTLVYLYLTTGEEIYLDRARWTARFLLHEGWDRELQTFPFEHPSPSELSHHRAYFFDCGIIIRGLLAVWRQTKEQDLLDLASSAARAMIADFRADADFHPILELPDRQPLSRTDHWSRSAGSYQLKSAMSWLEVAEATGEPSLKAAYLEMLDFALAAYPGFLPAATPHATMDRLHPACYFLEALTPVLDRADCASAFASMLISVDCFFREISQSFTRCDVVAQLLRARIYGAEIVPLPDAVGEAEARTLQSFQLESEDRRLDGGYYFANRDGAPSPHVSPVSSGFGLQALQMWNDYKAGKRLPCPQLLI